MEDSTRKGGTARVRNCKRGTASERSRHRPHHARGLVGWTIHAPQSRSSTRSALARQVPLPARPTRALDPRAKARHRRGAGAWRWWRPQTSIAAPALGRRPGRAGRPCRRLRPWRWLRPPRLPRLHDLMSSASNASNSSIAAWTLGNMARARLATHGLALTKKPITLHNCPPVHFRERRRDRFREGKQRLYFYEGQKFGLFRPVCGTRPVT